MRKTSILGMSIIVGERRVIRGFFPWKYIYFSILDKKYIFPFKFLDEKMVEHTCIRPGMAKLRPNLGKFRPKRGIFEISPKKPDIFFFDARD